MKHFNLVFLIGVFLFLLSCSKDDDHSLNNTQWVYSSNSNGVDGTTIEVKETLEFSKKTFHSAFVRVEKTKDGSEMTQSNVSSGDYTHEGSAVFLDFGMNNVVHLVISESGDYMTGAGTTEFRKYIKQ